MTLTIPEIQEQFKNEYEGLLQWYETQPAENFSKGPEGQWSAGQHLYHMIKSTKPLARGLGFPPFALRLKFGSAKNGSKDYEAVIKTYKDALDAGGKAMGEYVPRPVKDEEKGQMIQRMKEASEELNASLGKWKEEKLDKIQAPHPLIGKLTIREMMYFTIYHTQYHKQILQERY